MKRILMLPVLAVAVLILASFEGKTRGATAFFSNDREGSLAYTVDGRRVVVKRPATSFYLNEVSHNPAKGSVRIKVTIFPMGELFNFLVDDKGTTDIEHYKPSFQEKKAEAVYLSPEGHNYYGDHVSVVINSIDALHVTGTFSGTFTAEGKTVTIKDGSFDLAMKAKK